MHWVLIYFLTQPVYPDGPAGGVGQIRFKTEAGCQHFYSELEKQFAAKKVHAKGVCMVWRPV